MCQHLSHSMPRMAPSEGMLHITLHDATGLKAADKNGLSDPYVAITPPTGKKCKSKVQRRTLSPAWEEAFALRGDFDGLCRGALHLAVFDHDDMSFNDKLGDADVDLNALPLGNGERIERQVILSDGQSTPATVRLSLRWEHSKPPMNGILEVCVRRAEALPEPTATSGGGSGRSGGGSGKKKAAPAAGAREAPLVEASVGSLVSRSAPGRADGGAGAPTAWGDESLYVCLEEPLGASATLTLRVLRATDGTPRTAKKREGDETAPSMAMGAWGGACQLPLHELSSSNTVLGSTPGQPVEHTLSLDPGPGKLTVLLTYWDGSQRAGASQSVGEHATGDAGWARGPSGGTGMSLPFGGASHRLPPPHSGGDEEGALHVMLLNATGLRAMDRVRVCAVISVARPAPRATPKARAREGCTHAHTMPTLSGDVPSFPDAMCARAP